MAIPFRQQLQVGAYLARQKLARRKQFPLIVELEPLFACNLACAGCGKIQYPTEILRQRVVGRAGRRRDRGVRRADGVDRRRRAAAPPRDRRDGRRARRRARSSSTSARTRVLLRRKLDLFEPSPYFAWAVHVDGLRERHDESVCRDGVFDEARRRDQGGEGARASGSRPTRTFFNTDTPETVRDVLDFLNDELEVDAMMISPGYAYEKAPDQEHFLGVEQTRRCSARRSPTAAASAGG